MLNSVLNNLSYRNILDVSVKKFFWCTLFSFFINFLFLLDSNSKVIKFCILEQYGNHLLVRFKI